MTAAAWLFVTKTFAGYQMLVGGLAPLAARYAGFKESRTVWVALLISGGAAGLAGVGEVAGPLGQLLPTVSPGYGFAAIIVAFVGRLHPFGIVVAGLLMSLLYLGGEAAQIALQVPYAVTSPLPGGPPVLPPGERSVRVLSGPHRAAVLDGEPAMTDLLVPLLAGTVAAATPLIFAALGELVTEKSGVLNLGVEGMMLMGAIGAFAAATTSGSLALGVVCGALAGAATAALFALLTLTLLTNQVATGLALTIFGTGLSAFVGQGYVSLHPHRAPADRRARVVPPAAPGADPLRAERAGLPFAPGLRRRSTGCSTGPRPG